MRRGTTVVAGGDALMSARTTFTRGQALSLGALLAVGVALVVAAPICADAMLLTLQIGFLGLAAWRLFLLWMHRGWRPPAAPSPAVWPRYTVVAALYHEAEILPYLIERLSNIDYPADRLEGFLALEADDVDTIETALRLPRPPWLQVLIVPPGAPQTKPRALNYALARATGDLMTIYDAEDDPDPLQLREAAARFVAEGDSLACLQAPLRIRRRHKYSPTPFLDRQFAAEYAALFEITLPAMSRLGLPFPLGGTSNHFRVPVLRALGGWDAWNVTEDADLGFRVWRAGYRLCVIQKPTYEPPPGPLRLWLPQRTRWLKGYLQTLAVHSRYAGGMGWRGWTALSLTIGAGAASAAVHAACTAWVFSVTLTSVVAGRLPQFCPIGVAVLASGIGAAWLMKRQGVRQAGGRYGLGDMIASVAYWCLLSLAFAHAAIRLILEPHRWDKTPHQPEAEPDIDACACPDAGRAAA
ncbi:Beta-monoglucosyldiacylglycerol synthase [compost metagenome]